VLLKQNPYVNGTGLFISEPYPIFCPKQFNMRYDCGLFFVGTSDELIKLGDHQGR
jgi:hypothetical protein